MPPFELQTLRALNKYMIQYLKPSLDIPHEYEISIYSSVASTTLNIIALQMSRLPMKYFFRLLSDFVLVTILLAISLNFSKIWGPIKKRAFFCDDESLKYPLHKDTIGYPILFSVGLALPVLTVIMCSFLENFILNSRPSKNSMRFLIIANDTVLAFLYGFAAERLLKQIGKFSLGRLRPYFFAVCQPIRWDGTTCSFRDNYNSYMDDYECQGDAAKVMDITMRSSFPSGHASLVFYGMVFTICYLQRFSKCLRRYGGSFGLFVPTLQLLCVLLASFVAISRVADYKHHWSDVLAGGLMGASVAIAVVFYVDGQLRSVGRLLEAMDLPQRPPRPPQSGYMEGPTMSVVSTQVSDISRSELGGGGGDEYHDTLAEVQVHGQ